MTNKCNQHCRQGRTCVCKEEYLEEPTFQQQFEDMLFAIAVTLVLVGIIGWACL
jgi:hypothetical protein